MRKQSRRLTRLRGVVWGAIAALVLASACGPSGATPAPAPVEDVALLGGATTVFDITPNAFGLSARNLHREDKSQFFVGNSFFNQGWVAAPASTTARDGLGPLFNAQACSSCHFKDGRAQPVNDDHTPGLAMLFRLSVPGDDPRGGAAPEPTYGGQLQPRAILGMTGEARVVITYEEIQGQYGDGTPYTLRKPTYTFEDLAYGPMAPDVMLSPRIAPQVIGLGLLESIDEADLMAHADPDDLDGDGVSGCANQVWDELAQRVVMGRFGWKAEQPTVAQQNAAAFSGDMGLTTPIFPGTPCSSAQADCLAAPDGGDADGLEVDQETFDAVTFYTRVLAVPARRDVDDPQVKHGEQLFLTIGCATCHVPRHQTRPDALPDALASQTIRPYTDLLLHDMGEGLADGRPSFEASGREWRTPPLWGIGLIKTVNKHTQHLHDGRARSIEEAILWHGGEAEGARERFAKGLTRADREALLAFLHTL